MQTLEASKEPLTDLQLENDSFLSFFYWDRLALFPSMWLPQSRFQSPRFFWSVPRHGQDTPRWPKDTWALGKRLVTAVSPKHQRMRNYKECLQQYLPTDISSSRVVCKFSKHKSYRFVLWENLHTREFVSLNFVTICDEEIAKRRSTRSQNMARLFAFLGCFFFKR